MEYPEHLLKLVNVLRRLPGVGSKSAERFAFQMLDWKREHLHEMANVILGIEEHLTHCDECRCLIGMTACPFCNSSKRYTDLLCIVSSVKDVFAIEETREYQGLYHVLGGVLSPIEGLGPDRLAIDKLKKRISAREVKEVVIALDTTLEGDTTALYVKRELESLPIKTSRLAFGLPMGSSLDYVDGGTLAKAFSGRGAF